MSTASAEKKTALPSVLQQILSQPGVINFEALAALAHVSKPLGPLCEPYYNHPLVVVLRSADQAESFALWVAKHGRHIPSLTITADGEWISNTYDDNIPAEGRGLAAWTKIWHNLLCSPDPSSSAPACCYPPYFCRLQRHYSFPQRQKYDDQPAVLPFSAGVSSLPPPWAWLNQPQPLDPRTNRCLLCTHWFCKAVSFLESIASAQLSPRLAAAPPNHRRPGPKEHKPSHISQ